MNNSVPTALPPITIVAALSRKSRAIGYQNRLLWHIPDDLKRFKEKTSGKPIIMGRKTFESIVTINGRPLPKRPNIVVTRQPDFSFEGVQVAHSLDAAIAAAGAYRAEEIHIGGGEALYRQAMPIVDRLFLTYVDDQPEGDTFFPAIKGFLETKRHGLRSFNGLSYEWVDYVKA